MGNADHRSTWEREDALLVGTWFQRAPTVQLLNGSLFESRRTDSKLVDIKQFEDS